MNNRSVYDEYKKATWEIDKKARAYRETLYPEYEAVVREYAEANSTVAIGDVLKGPMGSIVVEELILHRGVWQGARCKVPPYIYYRGTELTSTGEKTAYGTKLTIRPQEVISVVHDGKR